MKSITEQSMYIETVTTNQVTDILDSRDIETGWLEHTASIYASHPDTPESLTLVAKLEYETINIDTLTDLALIKGMSSDQLVHRRGLTAETSDALVLLQDEAKKQKLCLSLGMKDINQIIEINNIEIKSEYCGQGLEDRVLENFCQHMGSTRTLIIATPISKETRYLNAQMNTGSLEQKKALSAIDQDINKCSLFLNQAGFINLGDIVELPFNEEWSFGRQPLVRQAITTTKTNVIVSSPATHLH